MASACASSQAEDLAILRNGNSIRHQHREVFGAITRLYLGDSSTGYIEIPTDQILRFEADPDPSPVPKQSPSMVAVRSSPQAQTPVGTAARGATLDQQGLNILVNNVGQRHRIDPDFINSVIHAESGFHSRAVSRKGAQGLMQLMPGTASQLGVANPFDPKANVEGGTRYLRELLEKYNYDVPKALAAYNAGPGRVDRYKGVPPYFETQTYVAKIIRDYNRKKLAKNPSLAHKAGTARVANKASKLPSKTRAQTVAEHSLSAGQQTASR
ncbi:MAG TPA: lytic transglycosylase domain-containing protein [Terriglobales bacterium]